MALANRVGGFESALNYDLMTKTAHVLADVGRSLSWGDLSDFVANLPPDSALIRAMNPQASAWASGAACASLLADVYDAIIGISAELCAMCGVTAQHKPPGRPGDAEREMERVRVARERLEEFEKTVGGTDEH